MAHGVTLHEVDTGDRAALERHVAFEREHGTPRHSVDELLAWLPTVVAARLIAALGDDGAMVGCATASIAPQLGGATVQLNAHVLAGRSDVLDMVVRSLGHWEPAAGASAVLAHVTNPTPAQEADWRAAGFECVGTRTRLERPVTDADRELQVDLPAGIEVVAARDRPELLDGLVDLWNEALADVPTALPFQQVDRRLLLEELEVAEGEPLPGPLLVAVDVATGAVVGVVYLNMIDAARGIAGHRLTGVSGRWRGRGLARALKAQIVRWAACNGFTALRATNDDGNPAMLAVNRSLGYREQFRIVMYRRSIEGA